MVISLVIFAQTVVPPVYGAATSDRQFELTVKKPIDNYFAQGARIDAACALQDRSQCERCSGQFGIRSRQLWHWADRRRSGLGA